MPLINPESALLLVESAIATRKPGQTTRYALMYFDGTFRCIPTEKFKAEYYNLGFFTEYQLEEGLTVEEWHCLKARIAVMMKKMEVKIEEGTSKS